MIDLIQRTDEENRLLKFVRFPEMFGLMYLNLVLGTIVTVYWVYTKPMQHAANRERTLLGAMNQHELWKRNREMVQIFEYHRQLIEQTRQQYAPRPACYDAPTTGNIAWTNTKKV